MIMGHVVCKNKVLEVYILAMDSHYTLFYQKL